MESRSRFEPLLLGAVLLCGVGLVLRLAFLDADPTYAFWSGWVTDEGRWTEMAREWVLFGAPEIDTDLGRTHLVLGPLFQAAAAAVFWVAGVGPLQVRMLSVLSGLGILVVAGLFLRRRLGPRPALAAVALLAVQPDLIAFSRVAIPEMAALFFEFCAFTLLVGGPRTLRRAVLGGVMTAVALGVKGTTAPIVPVFALVVWMVHRPGDPARRWARVAGFLAAVALPGVAFVVGYGVWTGGLGSLLGARGGMLDIVAFLQLNSLYGAVATLHESAWAVRVNLLLAASWGLTVLIVLRGLPETEARAVFLGAVTWAGSWLIPWVALAYFPERYVAHIHLPLVVALVAGVVVLRQPGTRSLDEALAALGPRGRWATGFLLAIPLAAALAPSVLALLGLVASPVVNLRYHLMTIIALALLLAGVTGRRWTVATVVTVGVTAPLAVALAWQIARVAGVTPWAFWSVDGRWTALGWGATLLAAVALIRAAGVRMPGGGAHRAGRVAAVYAGAMAVLWMVDGVGRLADRTYVLAEARASLEEHVPPHALVGVQGGTSILLGTEFRYREMFFDDGTLDVVLAFADSTVPEHLAGHRIVDEFMIDLGPRYFLSEPPLDRIRIYARDPDHRSRSGQPELTTGSP